MSVEVEGKYVVDKQIGEGRVGKVFSAQNNDQYPKELADLERVGVANEVIEVILAAPDMTDGPAVIRKGNLG